MSLAELKKKRTEMLLKLQEDVKSIDDGPRTKREDDSRYWKPTQGADGNGSAVVRFLPPPEGEDKSIVHYFKYQFKWPKTNKYYYERSLSSLGLPDPVADYKKQLRDSGQEELSKKMNRSAKYISNVLIVKDPGNPENEGRVYLYEYGKQIYDLIKRASTDDDETGRVAFNPFDLWESKNFVLKVKKKSDFPNYEDSTFQEKITSVGNDDYIEKIYSEIYSLEAEVAPEKYSTYEELEAKLKKVLGDESNSTSSTSRATTTTTKQSPRDLKSELDDEIPFSTSSSSADDDNIDELLKGINLDD